METKESSESMATLLGEPESSSWFIGAVAAAEPLSYLLSGLVLVSAVVLLVAKTKMPGRFLLLSGVVLVCAPLPFLMWRSSSVTLLSVNSFAVSKLILSSAAFLSAVGFGRLVLHLYKSERNK